MNPIIRKTGLALLFIIGSTASTAFSNDTSPARHTGATEIQWTESGFGPLVATVDGDMSSGRHITYVRFTENMSTPLHTHTHDYVGIVISGVTMHWEPGKPETRKQLSAGAHWYIPANVRHVSECLPGAECIMAIYQQNPMDFVPVKQ